MKILAIRGNNLASLAGEFEVDFQIEPLASAGVFAITGPTGAGKSTLLDALSLALFHDTPRLMSASEKGVDIPDVADKSITPRDPRNILRRGAGEGHAEVDFVGLNGERWRARWEVRRARGKPDGALQQARASFENLDRNEQHGGKIRETRESIEKETGLSYAQFCRSILLAQNEFAAFLRASGAERAELLEALTGTEIYKQISRHCHLRTSEEKRKVDELETRLGIDPPLDEDKRTELEGQLQTEKDRRGELDTESKALKREADWHEDGRKLRENQRGVENQLKESRDQRAGREGDAALVRRLEAIEPARPLHRDLNKATATLKDHETRRNGLESALAETEAAHEKAGQNVAKASSELEAAEVTQRKQAPGIRRARELDRTISELLAKRDEHVQRSEVIASQLNDVERKCVSQNEELTRSRVSRTEWSTWLDQHAELPGDSQRWSDAGGLLESAVQAIEKEEAVEARLNGLDERAEKAKNHIRALDEKRNQAQRALERARAARAAAEQQVETHDADELGRERKRLDERERGFDRLEELMETHSSAIKAVDEIRSRVNANDIEQSNRSKRLSQVNQAIPEATGRLEQARKAWQRISAIANQHTAALRRELVDSEPCPVCGSMEHPGHTQNDDEVNRLLDELADQEKKAEEQLRSLESDRTRLEAKLGEGARQCKTLATDLERSQHGAVEALGKVCVAASGLDLDADDLERLPERLSDARSALKTETDNLEEKSSALEEARKGQRTAQEAFDASDRSAQEIEKELAEAREDSQPVLEQHGQAEQELRLQRQTVEDSVEKVSQTLNLDEALDRKAIEPLAEAWKEGDQLREVARLAENREPLLKKHLDEAQERVESLTREHENLTEHLEALNQSLDKNRRDREDCLSTDDPDALEIRFEDACQKARTAIKAATTQLNESKISRTRAQTNLQNWQQTLDTLRADQDRLRGELVDWLANHHAAPAVALEADDLESFLDLLATPASDWQPIRDELQQLDQAIRDNETRVAMLAEQIEKWQSSGTSKRDEADVQRSLEEATNLFNEAIKTVARLESEIAQDDRRRQLAAEQLENIQRQKSIHEQWSKLDGLIGSSTGAKFRDYAQQFALDVLIAHSNAQLQTLAPRYRLQRGNKNLNILVVDDDMGGEVRSVHSLSGGETFLASLALALGLAELSSQRIKLESLFIDEGFGSLDTDTLRVAMDALDRLQAQGRKVGVISHVQEMSDRIGTRITVERVGPGRSRIQVQG